MKIIHILGMLLVALAVKAASPIEGLLERIDKGASRKFMIEQEISCRFFRTRPER